MGVAVEVQSVYQKVANSDINQKISLGIRFYQTLPVILIREYAHVPVKQGPTFNTPENIQQ